MTRTFIALHVILLMFLTSYIKCISHNVACNQLISGHAVLHPIDVVRVAYYSQHVSARTAWSHVQSMRGVGCISHCFLADVVAYCINLLSPQMPLSPLQ